MRSRAGRGRGSARGSARARCVTIACLALLWLLPACKKEEAKRVAFYQIRPAGAHLLLVGHIPKEVTGTRQLSRMVLVQPDGKMVASITQRARLQVGGVTDEVIWVATAATPPVVRALDVGTLKELPRVTEAVADHAILRTNFSVLGLLGDALVLEGLGSNLYAVSHAGVITEVASRASLVPLPPTNAGEADRLRLPGKPLSKQMKKAMDAALKTGFVLQQGPAVLGRATSDELVLSADLSNNAAQVLSRIDGAGKTVWSRPVAELAAPVAVKNARSEIVGIAELADGARILIRSENLTRQQQSDYYEVEHRLVQLDPLRGQPTSSNLVTEK